MLPRQWNTESLQPRRKDYSGMGCALPSGYLELTDPSFVPKFQEIYRYHVPGFFGKPPKYQKSDTTLAKQKGLVRRQIDPHLVLQGRKVSDMTPDERVEALLKAGLL
jgi:hypothetical protein